MEVDNVVLVTTNVIFWKKSGPRAGKQPKRDVVPQRSLNDVTVRQFGDTAILTGILTNKTARETNKGGTTVVFVRRGGTWLIASVQWSPGQAGRAAPPRECGSAPNCSGRTFPAGAGGEWRGKLRERGGPERDENALVNEAAPAYPPKSELPRRIAGGQPVLATGFRITRLSAPRPAAVVDYGRFSVEHFNVGSRVAVDYRAARLGKAWPASLRPNSDGVENNRAADEGRFR